MTYPKEKMIRKFLNATKEVEPSKEIRPSKVIDILENAKEVFQEGMDTQEKDDLKWK